MQSARDSLEGKDFRGEILRARTKFNISLPAGLRPVENRFDVYFSWPSIIGNAFDL